MERSIFIPDKFISRFYYKCKWILACNYTRQQANTCTSQNTTTLIIISTSINNLISFKNRNKSSNRTKGFPIKTIWQRFINDCYPIDPSNASFLKIKTWRDDLRAGEAFFLVEYVMNVFPFNAFTSSAPIRALICINRCLGCPLVNH